MGMTHGQVKHSIWRDIVRATKPVCKTKNETYHTVELINGSTIQAASAEKPDAIRGSGFDGVILDEAAFMDKEVWQQVLRPAVEDRGGWAVFITTPNGKNWFYDLFKSAEANTSGQWQTWQRPSTDNPLMDADRIKEAIDEVGPRAYEQEFEAKFVSVEGAVWPGEYFPDEMWVESWPEQVYTTQMAIDPSLGKTGRSDYSAIVVGRLDINTGIIYFDTDLQRRDPTVLCEHIVDMAMKVKPDRVTFEANGFQSVLVSDIRRIAMARGYPIPVFCTNNKIEKTARIKNSLTPYLNQGVIRIVGKTRSNKIFHDQMVTFPVGDHDDGPDAADMVIRAMWDHFYTNGLEENNNNGPIESEIRVVA